MRDWWLEEATPSSTTEAIPFQFQFLFWWWRGHYLQTEVKNSTKRILLLWWRAPSPETMQKPFHQQDDFLNLKRERDREKYQEGRVHTTYTSGSRFRRGSHIFHEWDDNKAMQREIDDLKKQLHWAQQRRSPSNSDFSSDDEKDTIYRQRSRTPPSESFSYDEERHHRRKCRSPSCKGVGIDIMKKALSQISKSPFTRGIENAKLPRRFYQLTFAIYNGWTDPVEHVSQFKQKIAVHSQDEALMCRVFPSNLGLMAMRWFNGLRTNSVSSFKKLT